MARNITTQNYEKYNAEIAMWAILDNIVHTLEPNTPETAFLYRHRADNFTGSIDDFTRALQLTTNR